jgi:hypothetical protein
MRRRRLHRLTFLAAGLYNICWGGYAVWDPQWLFRLADMPLSNTPEIFATLGMVLGLYGILYLEVARVPERGWLPAAVGLAGKILGPLGLAWLILTGRVAAEHCRAGRDQRPRLVDTVRRLPRRRPPRPAEHPRLT